MGTVLSVQRQSYTEAEFSFPAPGPLQFSPSDTLSEVIGRPCKPELTANILSAPMWRWKYVLTQPTPPQRCFLGCTPKNQPERALRRGSLKGCGVWVQSLSVKANVPGEVMSVYSSHCLKAPFKAPKQNTAGGKKDEANFSIRSLNCQHLRTPGAGVRQKQGPRAATAQERYVVTRGLLTEAV